MKKGLVILILSGIALLAFLYFSPVSPSASDSAATASTEETEEQTEDNLSPEQQVDEALRLMQSGELPPMQAILKIRDVAENYPGNVKANLTLGNFSMQTAQFDKAIERFTTVLEQQPENGIVHRLLAEAYLRNGDTAKAQQSFDKALELVDEQSAAGFKAELPELSK